MHHLLGFASTLAASAGYQAVNAIADAVFARTNAGADFQIPRDMHILGAGAGAAANVRTRLVTPTFALKGYPQVVPIEGTLLPATNPNFMDFTAAPLQLYQEEALHCDMESNSATLARCFVWICDTPDLDFTIQFKDLRWVRATASVTTVAGAWSSMGTIVFDEPMEGGNYAVYGMQAFFATALAARLVFPGQVMRPGCLGQATAVYRSAPIFWGGMGLWGRFDTFALPQLEVVDTASATVTYTIWLLLARAGSGAYGG